MTIRAPGLASEKRLKYSITRQVLPDFDAKYKGRISESTLDKGAVDTHV